jgi:hypothetical protein
MPDRIIRAAILLSDRVNSLSWGAEVFYRRLMSVADDYGRYDGRLSILRAHLFALKIDRVSELDIGKWIRECDEAGLIAAYTIEEKQFVEIQRFGQRTRTDSKWPAPPSSADKCPQKPASGGQMRPYSYAESYSNSDAYSQGAPASADAVGTPAASSPPPPTKAPKAEPKPRERNPLFDALALAEGNQLDAITKPAASAIAVALSQIRKVSPDVTPAEIQRRADNYRASMPGATLTATALAKHWGRMDDPPLQFRVGGGSGRPELGGAMAR